MIQMRLVLSLLLSLLLPMASGRLALSSLVTVALSVGAVDGYFAIELPLFTSLVPGMKWSGAFSGVGGLIYGIPAVTDKTTGLAEILVIEPTSKMYFTTPVAGMGSNKGGGWYPIENANDVAIFAEMTATTGSPAIWGGMPHGASSTKILKFQIGGIIDPSGIPVGLPLGRRLQQAVPDQNQAIQEQVRTLATNAAIAAGRTRAEAEAAGEAAAQAVARGQAQGFQQAKAFAATHEQTIVAAKNLSPAQQQALAKAQAAAKAKARVRTEPLGGMRRHDQPAGATAGSSSRRKIGPLAAAIRKLRRSGKQGRRLSAKGGSTKRSAMEWWGGVAVFCTPPMLCMCIKWQKVPPPVFFIPIPLPCTKIYTIPYAGQVVMIINPPSDIQLMTHKGNKKCKDAPAPGTCNTITCNIPPKQMCPIIDRTSIKVGGAGKRTGWTSGILVGSSIMTRIYALPWTASSVLIINPASNSADTNSIKGFVGSYQWSGGVLVGSKIYGIPYQNNSVLILDTNTKSTDTKTITGLTGGWWGGAEYNGRIFAPPHNLAKASCVLIIDTKLNTADYWSICGTVSAEPPYFSPFTNSWRGAIAAGSMIYGIPWEGKSLLMIDATTPAPTPVPTEAPTDAPTASPSFSPTPAPTATRVYVYTLTEFTLADFKEGTLRGDKVRAAFIETVGELAGVPLTQVTIVSVSWSTHGERRMSSSSLVVVEFMTELTLSAHLALESSMTDSSAGGFGSIFLSKLAAAGQSVPSGVIAKPYKMWPVGSLGNPAKDKTSSTPTTLIMILAFAGLVALMMCGVVTWVWLSPAMNSASHHYAKVRLETR